MPALIKVTEQDFLHYINYAVSIVQPCIAEISTPDAVYPDLTDQVVTTEEAQIAMEILQGKIYQIPSYNNTTDLLRIIEERLSTCNKPVAVNTIFQSIQHVVNDTIDTWVAVDTILLISLLGDVKRPHFRTLLACCGKVKLFIETMH